MANLEGYEYRDPASLVKWTRWYVYAHLVTASLAVISGLLEYGVLTAVRDETFESPEAIMSAAESSDRIVRVVAVLQFVAILVSGVLSLRWIHRANWNARALGANGLEFTPGWSVGWYFIPLLNLWKPYQAMKQIWQASADPADWQLKTTPALLGWWWASWVAYSLLGNASFRAQMRGEDIDALITTNVITLLSDIAAIPLSILFLLLIQRIQDMQARTSSRATISAATLQPESS